MALVLSLGKRPTTRASQPIPQASLADDAALRELVEEVRRLREPLERRSTSPARLPVVEGNQEVLDTYGIPTSAWVNQGGELLWSYQNPGDEADVDLVFVDSMVVRMDY